jgi:hypothetical protein
VSSDETFVPNTGVHTEASDRRSREGTLAYDWKEVWVGGPGKQDPSDKHPLQPEGSSMDNDRF